MRFPEAISLCFHTAPLQIHLIYGGCVMHPPASTPHSRAPPADSVGCCGERAFGLMLKQGRGGPPGHRRQSPHQQCPTDRTLRPEGRGDSCLSTGTTDRSSWSRCHGFAGGRSPNPPGEFTEKPRVRGCSSTRVAQGSAVND